MVKRKDETVKDNPIYLCSHFSQWTTQEYTELSKITAVVLWTAQWNIGSEIRVYKNIIAFPKYTIMISFSHKESFHVQQNAPIPWRLGKFVSQSILLTHI